MKISLAEIEVIKAELSDLEPPLEAVRDMPIKEVIMALAPELHGMVSRGYTTEGLLDVLKKRNISLTGRSLNSYLKEFKEGRREGRKRGRKASAIVDSSSPQVPAARSGAGNFFTPSEDKNAVAAASARPEDEAWREPLKDLI
ncbi:hypothetical protein LJB99_01350 [Deltaproteobacteria bacterium OttesenSCG-928-K17]|nr:hypothetical protein [Deltaproteobacteria bacterium OttesenSCG-928-K17]